MRYQVSYGQILTQDIDFFDIHFNNHENKFSSLADGCRNNVAFFKRILMQMEYP